MLRSVTQTGQLPTVGQLRISDVSKKCGRPGQGARMCLNSVRDASGLRFLTHLLDLRLNLFEVERRWHLLRRNFGVGIGHLGHLLLDEGEAPELMHIPVVLGRWSLPEVDGALVCGSRRRLTSSGTSRYIVAPNTPSGLSIKMYL